MNATLGTTVDVRRLLIASTPDLAAHDQAHGPLPAPHDLVSLLRDAGLHGHGGAAFPTWRKLAALPAARPRGIDHVQHAGGRFARHAGIANRPQALRSSGESGLPAGRDAIVVANGAEGEPASAKDRTLLRTAPHLVLDGLALVGAAVGATRAIVYVPSDLVPVMSRAVAERRVRDRIAVQVVEAPDTFVAGEETAVVSRLSGGPALPLDKFTRIVESGVDGRPTVLNNVETLAHIALIARHGAGGSVRPGPMRTRAPSSSR